MPYGYSIQCETTGTPKNYNSQNPKSWSLFDQEDFFIIWNLFSYFEFWMLYREIGLLAQTPNIPKRTRKAPFNQWAWGSNPHGRTKTATFFGVSQFFVVSTPKRGHEWGFEKRGPPPIRRAKNAVARHFLACGRGPHGRTKKSLAGRFWKARCKALFLMPISVSACPSGWNWRTVLHFAAV